MKMFSRRIFVAQNDPDDGCAKLAGDIWQGEELVATSYVFFLR